MAVLFGPPFCLSDVIEGVESVFSAGAAAAVTVFTVPACVIMEGWTFFVGEAEEGCDVVLGLDDGEALAGVESPSLLSLFPPALATEATRPVSCTDQASEPPPVV